jgi:hypothetical protein
LSRREIRRRVVADDARGNRLAGFAEAHSHLGRVADDVLVGDDGALPVDEEAGSDPCPPR